MVLFLSLYIVPNGFYMTLTNAKSAISILPCEYVELTIFLVNPFA